jgi:hypothetical protein
MKSENCLILFFIGQDKQDLLDIFLASRMKAKNFQSPAANEKIVVI